MALHDAITDIKYWIRASVRIRARAVAKVRAMGQWLGPWGSGYG